MLRASAAFHSATRSCAHAGASLGHHEEAVLHAGLGPAVVHAALAVAFEAARVPVGRDRSGRAAGGALDGLQVKVV